MRKLTFFVILCLAGGVDDAVNADCAATYDPAAQVAYIPCVNLTTADTTQSFSVSLAWTGGNNFMLTSSTGLDVRDPHIDLLKIVETPYPVAIIYGSHGDGCWGIYGKPSIAINWTDRHIDITLKEYALQLEEFACPQVIVPFAEAVTLPDVMDENHNPILFTYSVNGVVTVPTY